MTCRRATVCVGVPALTRLRAGVCAAVVLLLTSTVACVTGSSPETPEALARLAAQAAAYALPLVIMDLTREQASADPGAEPNRFLHSTSLANTSSRAVVRPNVDTLYSSAWLDLTAEPAVLTVPPNRGRYFMIQCMDAWTNVFADPGVRTLGNAPAAYAIVGPDWRGNPPAGATVVRAPTRMVWVLARVYARNGEDLPAARDYQRQLDVRPLSRTGDASFQSTYARPEVGSAQRPVVKDLLARMGPEAFFERFLTLTAANPPAPQDAPFIGRVLDPLGLSPGGPRPWGSIPPSDRDALGLGLNTVLDAFGSRAAAAPGRPQTVNGWLGVPGTDGFPIGSYGTNYFARAAVAVLGLGANLPADAVYPNTSRDASGNRLDGSRAYRLRFDAGRTPPVRGFWSVTLYDEQGFLVANSLGRYAIRSGDDLVYEPDGSLLIYLQPDDPGSAHRANWLPTPRGEPFALTLRAYWPTDQLLGGRWAPPPVVPND